MVVVQNMLLVQYMVHTHLGEGEGVQAPLHISHQLGTHSHQLYSLQFEHGHLADLTENKHSISLTSLSHFEQGFKKKIA